MALIKCPECNKEISSKARSCPNCGYPLEEKKEEKKELSKPKKRFSSREYKIACIILTIPCTLLFLIFVLGITCNHIIASLMASATYGFILYGLSKTLLTTKPRVKKYLWIVILFAAVPLITSLVLLTKNETWYYSKNGVTNEIQVSALGFCRYYYKDDKQEIKSTYCNILKSNIFDYEIDVTSKYAVFKIYCTEEKPGHVSCSEISGPTLELYKK